MLLQYFQKSKEYVQALPLRDHFIAKSVILVDLEFELLTERINVRGIYNLEFEFEHLHELEQNMLHMPHFNRDPMFGEFEMTIDRNRQVTIPNPTIGELLEDGTPIFTRFRLGPDHLELVKKMREIDTAAYNPYSDDDGSDEVH